MQENVTTRRCGKCKQHLPLDTFNSNVSYCKPCQAQYRKERRLKFLDPTGKLRWCTRCEQYLPLEQFANHDYCRACQAAYHQTNKQRYAPSPEVTREKRLQAAYGINNTAYQSIFIAQNGVCAICGSAPDEGQNLHVDHDHESGVVRGLLCFNCNSALGKFGDDIGRLASAIKYLVDRSTKK
jgi:hypothetical protein